MERPTGSSHLAFTMAALVAAGGVSGYLKSRSVPSLVAGLGIAALFGAGGQQINVRVERRECWICWLTGAAKQLAAGQRCNAVLLPWCCRGVLLPTPATPSTAERPARCWAPTESTGFTSPAGCHGTTLCQDAQGW